MPEERKFARFRPTAEPDRMVFTVPEDGMCVSTFLLLRPRGHSDRVLVGRLDPAAPWGHLGALDPRRAEMWSKGWMLPSSQLTYYESPEASARRIAQEQLGLELGELPAPLLMSDTTRRATGPPENLHWDMGFAYVLDGFPEEPPRHSAWKELRFISVGRTPRNEFVRGQEDVLWLAGMNCAD